MIDGPRLLMPAPASVGGLRPDQPLAPSVLLGADVASDR